MTSSEQAPGDVDPLIAFNHDCELLNASWSLDGGRTVEFRITGEAFERIHPFKRFTQRRGGRAGTRFAASIADIALGVLRYHGDAMLAAWGDSSTLGQHFKLWLDDESDRHPFAGFTRRKGAVPGDLFAVVLVEMNDDETPVDQRARAAIENSGAQGAGAEATATTGAKPASPATGGGHHRPRKPAKFSSTVHLMVTGPRFVRWLQETHAHVVKSWTPDLARVYVKKTLAIESLSELDRNQEAVKRFHEKIRRPFETWNFQDPP